MQGQHLQRGSRLVDFDIRLGDSACVPVSLTDNQVDCRPPTNKPNDNVTGTFCRGDTLSLRVRLLIPETCKFFFALWHTFTTVGL